MNIHTFDASTIFATHTGSSIGGVAPLTYSCTPLPTADAVWLFSTQGNSDPTGKAYPAAEWYQAATAVADALALPAPILPNTGKLSLSYTLTVDEATQTAANVIETDLILVTGGYKYNLSGQRHVASGEIDDGNWTDTGLRVGELTSDTPHAVQWSYSFNATTHTCSVLSYACDGVVHAIATPFQNMPALSCNWTTGVYLQIQMGSLPAAARWEMTMGDLAISWS